MKAQAVKLKLILLAVDHPSNAELYERLRPYENWQSGVQTRQKMNNTLWPFPEMTNKSDTAISNSPAVTHTWSFITSLSPARSIYDYLLLFMSFSQHSLSAFIYSKHVRRRKDGRHIHLSNGLGIGRFAIVYSPTDRKTRGATPQRRSLALWFSVFP